MKQLDFIQHWALLCLFTALLSFSSFNANAITGYQHQNIQGYDVYIELDALNNHPTETQQAITLLNQKLEEINGFGLLTSIEEKLQSVKIFMDWNTTNGAAVYHPNLQWLIDNGYIEDWCTLLTWKD